MPDRYLVRVHGKYGFIDRRGEVVIPSTFEYASFFSEGLAQASRDGLYGFIDLKGDWAIPPRYEQVGHFCCGRAPVKIGDRWGWIDTTGNLVIPAEYAGAYGFSEGLAAACVELMWGYIDTEGFWVIPPSIPAILVEGGFSSCPASFSKGMALLFNPNRYIDRSGRVVFAPENVGVGSYSEGLVLASDTEGRHFFLDLTGRHRCGGQFFKTVFEFREGLAQAIPIGAVEDRWGVIDSSGDFVVEPRFHFLWGYHEGLASAEVDVRGIGYIDRTGYFVIPPNREWKVAGDFHDGIAYVSSGSGPDSIGYIRADGKSIWPPATK